jgi:hypothetical protein
MDIIHLQGGLGRMRPLARRQADIAQIAHPARRTAGAPGAKVQLLQFFQDELEYLNWQGSKNFV